MVEDYTPEVGLSKKCQGLHTYWWFTNIQYVGLCTSVVHQNTRSRLTHQSIIHLLNRHKNCGGSTEDTFQVYSPGGDLPYNKAKVYALISGITKDDV